MDLLRFQLFLSRWDNLSHAFSFHSLRAHIPDCLRFIIVFSAYCAQISSESDFRIIILRVCSIVLVNLLTLSNLFGYRCNATYS